MVESSLISLILPSIYFFQQLASGTAHLLIMVAHAATIGLLVGIIQTTLGTYTSFLVLSTLFIQIDTSVSPSAESNSLQSNDLIIMTNHDITRMVHQMDIISLETTTMQENVGRVIF